jgi:hypothetical protein
MTPEEWLRVRALELAVEALKSEDAVGISWKAPRLAQEFLDFIKKREPAK